MDKILLFVVDSIVSAGERSVKKKENGTFVEIGTDSIPFATFCIEYTLTREKYLWYTYLNDYSDEKGGSASGI